jgi:hypothetical protein
MFMKRARIALLAGLVLASAPVALRAFEDKAPADKGKEPAPAPKEAPKVESTAMPGCGGGTGTRIVYVNEWVPEQYQTTRTTYRTEYREEAYTAYRTENVQETRTRNVTKYVSVPTVETRTITEYVKVPSVETRTITKTVMVPCVETRTVFDKVAVCKPVTVNHRKLVRLGHWECKEVEPLFAKCGKSCDPCNPCGNSCTPTRTKRVWVHCPEYQDCCETKMVKSWECVPRTCQVTVCKPQCVTETVQVNVCKCVAQCRQVQCTVNKCVAQTCQETYTCCVPKCVAYQATRKVAHCVPCTENVTCCRMVCRQVAKTVADCNPCETSCCETKCCKSFDFGSKLRGMFSKGCGCNSGCSTGGCSSCGH